VKLPQSKFSLKRLNARTQPLEDNDFNMRYCASGQKFQIRFEFAASCAL
jgi:hypothetical protein